MSENKNAKTPADDGQPVAWRYKYPDGFWRFSNGERVNGSDSIKSQALYTAPSKQWVGLTDEEIHDAFNFTVVVKQLSWDREPERWCKNFAAYIEAKLKEKNT